MLYNLPILQQVAQLLCDHPSFCPMEGDVLNSADTGIWTCTNTTANVASEHARKRASKSLDALTVCRAFWT